MAFSYPITCYTPECHGKAVYKIAARWSDGVTQELKTYGLACPECLRAWFHHGRRKQAVCHLAPGEILDPPGIFQLMEGQRDNQLVRLIEMEETLTRESRTTSQDIHERLNL